MQTIKINKDLTVKNMFSIKVELPESFELDVTFDLENCAFIDSTGIDFLAAFLKRNCNVTLKNVNAGVREVLKSVSNPQHFLYLVGLDKLILSQEHISEKN